VRFQPGFRYGASQAAGATFLLDTYTNALVAYSLRKLRAAYAGSAVRIRRSSDNAEADIGFDGSGDFDTAAAATHIGGGSGFIVTWYDQSGNGDNVTQSTAGNQPLYAATGAHITTRPIVRWVDPAVLISTTDALAYGVGSAISASMVCSFDPGTYEGNGRAASLIASGEANDFANSGSCALFLPAFTSDFTITARNNFEVADQVLMPLTDTEPFTAMSIFDHTNHTGYVNTTASTPDAYSDLIGHASGNTLYFGSDPGGSNWGGEIPELIIWVSDQTANVAGIDADQATYYGI
jgi:hypothetical protein